MRRFTSLFLSIIAVMLVFGISSCKKDDKESSSEYMEGTLTYTLPGYLIVSKTIQLNASGITNPTTGLTYKWTTDGFSADSLEGQNVTITTPSITGDYTVSCRVSASGYYSKTNSTAVVVMDPTSEESLKGLKKSGTYIIDPRDGKQYYYSKIGSLDWFNYNLNYSGAGKAYNNEEVLALFMGRLYSWNEATSGVSSNTLGGGPRGVCPPGWSVPTDKDWEDFAKTLNNGVAVAFDSYWTNLGEKVTVNSQLNDDNIWKYSSKNSQKNLYTWNALPAGNMMSNLSRFENLSKYGFWWTSTEKDSNYANYRYIYFDSPDFPYNYVLKDYFGASVRCVRLAQ